MTENPLNPLNCIQCKHVWIPKKDGEKPKRCPNPDCRSMKWEGKIEDKEINIKTNTSQEDLMRRNEPKLPDKFSDTNELKLTPGQKEAERFRERLEDEMMSRDLTAKIDKMVKEQGGIEVYNKRLAWIAYTQNITPSDFMTRMKEIPNKKLDELCRQAMDLFKSEEIHTAPTPAPSKAKICECGHEEPAHVEGGCFIDECTCGEFKEKSED